jgi:uracil phosphoribosyltransferase
VFAVTAAALSPHLTFVYSEAVSVHLVDHPLVQDTLLSLRDVTTSASEALRDLPTSASSVTTPLGPAGGRRVATDVVVVPVLRAGLGMLDAVLDLWPSARVGHIGLQRDEMTAIASQYYSKLPADIRSSYVLVIDPMLATGGSAVAALGLLKEAGARRITIVCIVAAPEGVALVEGQFPDVRIYTPVIDRGLDGKKYIVPGLGDFGDRLYGTL